MFYIIHDVENLSGWCRKTTLHIFSTSSPSIFYIMYDVRICMGDVENTWIYCKFYIIPTYFYIISINSRGHLTRGTPHFPWTSHSRIWSDPHVLQRLRTAFRICMKFTRFSTSSPAFSTDAVEKGVSRWLYICMYISISKYCQCSAPCTADHGACAQGCRTYV